MTPAGAVHAGSRQVVVPVEGATLPGVLAWPACAGGVVVFAHGRGGCRLNPRHRFVARRLEHAGFATLLLDLLVRDEVTDRRNVLDVPLLTVRLLAGIGWLADQPETSTLPVGLFGVDTGAAAAIISAVLAADRVGAVVAPGGRPDLAGVYLPQVTAPTLLIVGGADHDIQRVNREGFERLLCPRELATIPGATQCFEEPGALEHVAEMAARWFGRYLDAGSRETRPAGGAALPGGVAPAAPPHERTTHPHPTPRRDRASRP